MLGDLETIKAASALVGLGAVIYFFAVGLASKLPRIRFERGSEAEKGKPAPQPQTPSVAPVPPQIHPIFEAVAAALRIRNQIAAQNGGIPPPPDNVPLRQAILTPEMLERGPVKDAPFIPWSDEATGRWLADQGFKLQFPVHIFRENTSGNLMFKQPMEPEKFYVRGG